MPQKPRGSPFKKGFDPKRVNAGRKKIDPDVYLARQLTDTEFTKAVGKIMSLKRHALEALVKSTDSNVFEQLIGTIWLKGIKDSSKAELNYFVERFLGKVAENHNFQGNVHTSIVDWLSKRNESPHGAIEKDVSEKEDEGFEDI